MPYVPVQRDEGRILYQSTMDRAKVLGDTLTGLGETLYKRDEENKAFRAKSSALKQLITTHKDQFGMDENTLKQFLGGDPDKSEKENYLNLATFIEGKVTAASLKKQADDVENSKAERALRFSQAANQQASADRTTMENLAMAAAAKELEAINKVPVSVDGTDTQTDATAFSVAPSGNASLGNISQFLTPTGTPQDPRANIDPRSNPIISSALTAQADPGPVPVSVPASVAANYGAAPSNVSSMPVRPRIPSQLNASDIDQQAKIAQLTEIRNTGKGKSIASYKKDIIETILKENRDARSEEAAVRADTLSQKTSAAEMTFEEAFAKSKQLEKDNPNSIFTVKPGTSARSYVLEQSPRPIVPLDARELAAFNAENKLAVEALDVITATSRTASDDLPRQERILTALQNNSTTGVLAPLSIATRKLLSETGLVDKGKLARDEVLASDLALDALEKTRTLLKGQGSVSDAERKRLDKVSLDINKEPGSILKLTQIYKAAAKRAIAADEYRSNLYENMDEKDVNRLIKLNRSMDKWYRQNTLTYFEQKDSKRFSEEAQKQAQEKKP